MATAFPPSEDLLQALNAATKNQYKFVQTIKTTSALTDPTSLDAVADALKRRHLEKYIQGINVHNRQRKIELFIPDDSTREELLETGLVLGGTTVLFQPFYTSELLIKIFNVPLEYEGDDLAKIITKAGATIKRYTRVYREYEGFRFATGERHFLIDTEPGPFAGLPSVIRLFGGRMMGVRYFGQPRDNQDVNPNVDIIRHGIWGGPHQDQPYYHQDNTNMDVDRPAARSSRSNSPRQSFIQQRQEAIDLVHRQTHPQPAVTDTPSLVTNELINVAVTTASPVVTSAPPVVTSAPTSPVISSPLPPTSESTSPAIESSVHIHVGSLSDNSPLPSTSDSASPVIESPVHIHVRSHSDVLPLPSTSASTTSVIESSPPSDITSIPPSTIPSLIVSSPSMPAPTSLTSTVTAAPSVLPPPTPAALISVETASCRFKVTRTPTRASRRKSLEPDDDDDMELSPGLAKYTAPKRKFHHKLVQSESESPRTPPKFKKDGSQDHIGSVPGFVAEPIHIADSDSSHIVAFGSFRHDLRDSSYDDIELKISNHLPNEPLSTAEMFVHYVRRDFRRDAALDGHLEQTAFHRTIAFLLHLVIGAYVQPCVVDFFNVISHPQIGRYWHSLDDLQLDPPKYRDASKKNLKSLANLLSYAMAMVGPKQKKGKPP